MFTTEPDQPATDDHRDDPIGEGCQATHEDGEPFAPTWPWFCTRPEAHSMPHQAVGALNPRRVLAAWDDDRTTDRNA